MRKEIPLPEERPVALRPGLWGGRHVRDEIDGYLVFDSVTQKQEFIKGEQAQVLWRLGSGATPSSLPANLLPAARELWRRGWLALARPSLVHTSVSPVRSEAKTAGSISVRHDSQMDTAVASRTGMTERMAEWVPRPGASFSCGSCGLCCRGFHDIGPVSERERLSVLSAAQLIERTRQRSAGEILQLALPEHPSQYWPYQIATQKGRCLFLSPQNRCSIHEKAGAAEKPLVCRTFPLQLSSVAGQNRVIASSRCPSVSLLKGAPIDREEVAQLGAQGVNTLQPNEPACGWDAYVEAERELLAALDDASTEERAARRTAFSAFLVRLGEALPEAVQVGRLYATAKRLEGESRQKGGEPLAAVAWGMRWSLHQRSKSPARPWQDAIHHSAATRSAGEALRRYAADQIYSGEVLQYQSITDGTWRLLQRLLLIEAHAKALVQAGVSREPYATAEAIYLWDFATMSEAWQYLSPNKDQ